MLQLRNMLSGRIRVEIGDGTRTFAWYDHWLNGDCLIQKISHWQIHSAGFRLDCKVADLCTDGEWSWPLSWIGGIIPYNLLPPTAGMMDKVIWVRNDGNKVDFSTSEVWNFLNRSGQEVGWWEIVWHKFCIPKHAFLLWLAFRNRLMTHDWISRWAGDSFDQRCCFCFETADSREHLFFQCRFARKVWACFLEDTESTSLGYQWDGIVDFLIAHRRRTTARIQILRLGLAAAVYHIWRERKRRFHDGIVRSYKDVYKDIFHDVRYKLMDPKFKQVVIPVCFGIKWRLPLGAELQEDGAGPSGVNRNV